MSLVDCMPLWWYHPESDSYTASETDPSSGMDELNKVGRFPTEKAARAYYEHGGEEQKP